MFISNFGLNLLISASIKQTIVQIATQLTEEFKYFIPNCVMGHHLPAMLLFNKEVIRRSNQKVKHQGNQEEPQEASQNTKCASRRNFTNSANY